MEKAQSDELTASSDWLLGTDVFVRCLKLLKPYGQKEVEEDDDDENNDEDGDASAKRSVLVKPRIIERDLLTQAYDIGQILLATHTSLAIYRSLQAHQEP